MKYYWRLTLNVVFKRGQKPINFQYPSNDENYDTFDFKLVRNGVRFTRFLIRTITFCPYFSQLEKRAFLFLNLKALFLNRTQSRQKRHINILKSPNQPSLQNGDEFKSILVLDIVRLGILAGKFWFWPVTFVFAGQFGRLTFFVIAHPGCNRRKAICW